MRTFFHSARRLAARAALVPAVAVAFVACDDNPAPPEVTPDIVDIALVTGDVSTLATAIQAAGLVEALKGDGPFTVFAPVNSAFADLPAGELDRLLEAENVAELQELLQFHVVSGAFLAADLSEGATLPTLAGSSLTISLQGEPSVNGAPIIATDIEAENGVIHLIDEVLLPPRPTITGLAAATGGLSSLAAALDAASLTGALAGEGPFTVFAPVNAAFGALGSDVIA
ncbi:MAG TPA: fasciclin domain-containing protein, partial [Longimicrobiales bacterium]|nr:fasciclin domain-containing protein [Longimicrobiales bacterium]